MAVTRVATRQAGDCFGVAITATMELIPLLETER